jgi:Icc-related predicted phosphoesterase
MKILFTADLHGLESAFVRYVELLKDYDIGVIAGDLQDDRLPENKIAELLGVPAASLRLDQEYDRFIDAYEALEKQSDKALEVQAIKLNTILNSANKPVLIIKGNHDRCAWPSNGNVHNIDQTSFKYEKLNFVGYQWTNFHRSELMQEADLQSLVPLMDENTVLVTHAPPYRVLDTITVHIFGYGPTKQPLGSQAIRYFVEKTHPKLHLFGHIHEGFGRRGNSFNGSYRFPKRFVGITIEGNEILHRELS